MKAWGFLHILFISGLVFGVCGLDFSVEMKYKVEEKIGSEYRRADVVLYIPLEETVEESQDIAKVSFKREGEELKLTIVPTKNFKGDLLLVIPLRNGYVHEEAYLEKIISEKPSVKEIYYIYPADLSPKKVVFPLPPSSPGEKLVMSIRLKGEVGNPYVKLKDAEVKKVKKPKFLKVVYSFNFGYAKTDTRDINVRNLKVLIDQLALFNRLKKVEIIGFADGKTKNMKKNEEVAKRRAISIARKLLADHKVACLLNKRGVAKLTSK